jgi:signal transduction histidine kinase
MINAKPKILIVDDKPENLVALETVLKELDIEVVKALGGNQALQETIYNDFALALLDVQMPEMDGYELAGILREEEKTAKLPIIFISAVYTDNLNVFKGYEQGAFSFITKPFQPELLINKVNFFIEKYLQERAVAELTESLKMKNDELVSINKELDAFSYSVSHDLRAPLRALNGYTQMLENDITDILSEESKRYLAAISANAKRMGTLIDGLLYFSKLGRKPLMKQEVNMTKMVEQIIKELKASSELKASFKVHALPPVQADDTLITQVMANLIDNAVKYSSKKDRPEIEIGAISHGHEIRYYVKDNGAGFDMQYADKLFGVFQRLHSHAEFEGTGIGLSIVDRIIKRHGGKVWAESEIDKGATFYFSLPL